MHIQYHYEFFETLLKSINHGNHIMKLNHAIPTGIVIPIVITYCYCTV